jgi:hypothetical protein
MSQGTACKDSSHRADWFVDGRKCNYSAFNGGHHTPSDYSQVWCPNCYTTWRTKAGYVDTLPDRDHLTLRS